MGAVVGWHKAACTENAAVLGQTAWSLHNGTMVQWENLTVLFSMHTHGFMHPQVWVAMRVAWNGEHTDVCRLCARCDWVGCVTNWQSCLMGGII
jgi:hypothetical protein